MIVGGVTDGDSNQAHKAHGRWLMIYGVGMEAPRGPTIGFGPEDLLGPPPHTDALVIQATIANYLVARVFMDMSSSVNIIFKEAFDQM